MSLNAKIKGAVEKAFAAAGDLVKTGTLSNTTTTGYDFSRGQTKSTTESETVEIILLDTKVSTSSDGVTTTAIMRSGPNLDVYDSLVVDSVKYRISDYSDNSFAIDLTLVKER